MSAIDLYLKKAKIGSLTRSHHRAAFTYRHDATEALSLTMPLRHETYYYEGLHPIFQMNLPEGHLRNAIERATAKQYGSDDLTLLTLLGPHQIGQLRYAAAGSPLSESPPHNLSLDTLIKSKDVTLFQQLLDQFALYSGVAGIHPKFLADLPNHETEHEIKREIEGKATLPLQPYIIKSWEEAYPQLGCNEALCLTFANNAGLNTPTFHLSNNGHLLIIERFDLNSEGEPIGFEDFCVLQGKQTREKYDSSLERCTHTLRHFIPPDRLSTTLYDFFKLTLVNHIIRNGDAHLKNIGILYPSLEGYRASEPLTALRELAPIFDIVSTVPYLPNDTMALTLAGSKRWPKWKTLQQFGKSHCGLSTAMIKQAAEEVEQACTPTLATLESLLTRHPAFNDVGGIIGTHLSQGLG